MTIKSRVFALAILAALAAPVPAMAEGVETCRTVSDDYSAQLSSSNANARHLVHAAHWQGEELQYAQNAPAAAIVAYDCALTLDPDHLVSLLGRAEALRKLDRHEAALADLDRAIALGADWTGHLMRARSREAMGDRTGAIADYRSVLAAYPGHMAARQTLAGWEALR